MLKDYCVGSGATLVASVWQLVSASAGSDWIRGFSLHRPGLPGIASSAGRVSAQQHLIFNSIFTSPLWLDSRLCHSFRNPPISTSNKVYFMSRLNPYILISSVCECEGQKVEVTSTKASLRIPGDPLAPIQDFTIKIIWYFQHDCSSTL